MTVITTGAIENPYRQFNETIPPGQIRVIRYVHNSMNVLFNDQPNDLEVSFGGSGGFTPMEAGIVYEYPNNVSIPFVELRNNSTQTMHIVVSLAVGTVKDNRLNVSGSVTVQGESDKPVYTSDMVFKAVNMQRISDMEAITPNVITPPADVKKTVIQNKGSTNLFVFSDGFIIQPMGVFEFSFSQPFAVISDEAGGKCIVAHFS